MIAAVIFVLAFLVLGLSVLFFAFSGRGGARTRRGAPSRAGRRFVAVMVTIVILALGGAVPLAIGGGQRHHPAEKAPRGGGLQSPPNKGAAGVGQELSTWHPRQAPHPPR